VTAGKRLHVEPAVFEEVNEARRTLDESRALGLEFLEEFETMSRSIQSEPGRFAPRAGRGLSGFEVRSAFLRRFRYRVIFVDLPGVVWVVALAHERQRPFYWRSRLKGPPPT